MSEIQVMGFQNTYPTINLKMQRENKKGYDYSILVLHAIETGNGFKVKKINKTTSKGTKVTFEAIKNEKDALDYRNLVDQKVKEFNDKWGTKMKLK